MIDSLPHALRDAVNLVSGHGGVWIYAMVLLAGVLENLFPPYPGDSMLFAGALLSASGTVLWPVVLLSAMAGNVAGAMLLFWFGATRGRRYFLTHHGRWIDPVHLHRIESWFERYGAKLILISRFLTGIRSAVALAAGVGRVPTSKMLSYTTISTLLWNGLIVALAVEAGRNWEAVFRFATLYRRLVLALLTAAALGWMVRQLYLRRRRMKNAAGAPSGGKRRSDERII